MSFLLTRMIFLSKLAKRSYCTSNQIIINNNNNHLPIFSLIQGYNRKNHSRLLLEIAEKCEDHTMSTNNWLELEKTISSSDLLLRANVIRSTLLRELSPRKQPQLLHSLIKHTLHENQYNNLPILATLLKPLAQLNHLDEFNKILHEVENRITPINQPIYLPIIIKSLIYTPRWKESIKYLNILNQTAPEVNFHLQKLFILCSIKNEDFYETFNQLNQFNFTGNQQMDSLWIILANLFSKINDFQPKQQQQGENDRDTKNPNSMENNLKKKFLLKSLKLLKDKSWMIDQNCAENFVECFESLYPSWKITADNVIAEESKCPSCRQKLISPKISMEEFNEMTRDFRKFIIEENDNEIFDFQQDLKELDKFLSLHQNQPFDCVIDFLNLVSILIANRELTSVKLQNLILKTAESLKMKFGLKKILIISVQHKVMFSHELTEYVHHIANILNIQMETFIIDRSADDDAFLLYAAMRSGPSCFVLSKDFFRRYKHLLPQKWSDLFTKWLRNRQMSVEGYPFLTLRSAQAYDISVHGSVAAGQLHIPYWPHDVKVLGNPNMRPKWLCLQARKER